MKLSVIMPAYNAEKFIGKAIDSVVQQSYKEWNLLIVNDCSNDNTQEIIQKYISSDTRIRLINLPKNSGNAYHPRKEAMLKCDGEYVVMMDSDDYLEEHYLEKIVNRLNETQADAVLGVMTIVTEREEMTGNSVPTKDFDLNQVLTSEKAFELTVPWKIGLNGAAFRRPILLKSLDQHKGYRESAWGDEVLGRMFLLNSDKIVFADAKYMYRLNAESITHQVSLRLFDLHECAQDIRKLCIHEFGKYSFMHKKAEKNVLGYFNYAYFQYMDGCKAFDKEQRKEFVNRFRIWYEDVDLKMIRKILNWKEKIYVLFGYKFYIFTLIFRRFISKCKNRL